MTNLRLIKGEVSPFHGLPFNTNKLYVMGTTPTGCEVYIPVKADAEIDKAKARLNDYLWRNYEPQLA